MNRGKTARAGDADAGAQRQLALASAVLRRLGELLSHKTVEGKVVPEFKVACHSAFMAKGAKPTSDDLKQICKEFARKAQCPLSIYKMGSGGGCLLVTSEGVSREVDDEGV